METVNILIATDCQVDFCDGALGTKEAQATVPVIVKKIDEAKRDNAIVIATEDTHGNDYLETNEGRHLPVPHTIRGTVGWQIVPAIQEALRNAGAKSIGKDRFGSPELAAYIRILVRNVHNIDAGNGKGLKITLIGWCTDICIISNALLLKAAFPEADIIVDSRCCAGVTPESHNAALTVLKSCQVTVI